MNYSTTNDTICVEGTEYDVEREHNPSTGGTTFTITLDGEPVFPGLSASVDYDHYDQSCADPRDWSNVGTMYVDYKGYTLGDDHAEDPREHMTECEACGGTGETHGPDNRVDGWTVRPPNCPACDGWGERELDPVEYLRSQGARVIMPLYVYEHSGITIRAGAPIGPRLTRDDARSSGRFVGDSAGWDTSFVGFVYDTPEAVAECIGGNATDDQIRAALDAEVEVYASYLEGDVTWYSVYDEETRYEDSCGGFVGGDGKHCEDECFASLEAAITARLAEDRERAYWAERGVETAA